MKLVGLNRLGVKRLLRHWSGNFRYAVVTNDFAFEISDVIGISAEDAGRFVLFQHNAFSVHVDFQRVLLADAQR